jgi:hypothetical protein
MLRCNARARVSVAARCVSPRYAWSEGMMNLHELFTLSQSGDMVEVVYGDAPWNGEPETVFIPIPWVNLYVALQTSKTWGELSSRIGTDQVNLIYLYSISEYDEEEIAQGLYPKPSANELFSLSELFNDDWDEWPDPRSASLMRAWLPDDLVMKHADEYYPAIPYGGGTWFQIDRSETEHLVNELRLRGYSCINSDSMIAEVYAHAR